MKSCLLHLQSRVLQTRDEVEFEMDLGTRQRMEMQQKNSPEPEGNAGGYIGKAKEGGTKGLQACQRLCGWKT